jgi:pyruvate kinase
MRRRKTRIICTIGPASSSPSVLERLIRAGMDAARLNFAHGSPAGHGRTVTRVRVLARRLGRPVALIQDLAGPRLRTGALAGAPVEMARGETWTVTGRRVRTRKGLIGVSHRAIAREIGKGARILIADGTLELKVITRRGEDLICRVTAGGILGAHKGVNLPGARLRLPSLTARDRRDLALGVAMGVDLVALSFVRASRDVISLRRELARRGACIPILAKIETPAALEDLGGIIDACDGLMVARGDLGVEMALEKVPGAQKTIIAAANRAGKPVITATQMLESMVSSPRPTRAEASDVANAILDGTDAVMLSEETSVGRYPVEAVRMMVRIIRETEKGFLPNPARSPRLAAQGRAL